MKNMSKCGISSWTDEEKDETICSTYFNGEAEVENISAMAADLFELAYNVTLTHLQNVLESPGFEACGLNLRCNQ